jgi:hypothetical protein
VYSADIGISLQEVFGGNAASDEYHIARHVANLFVVQTYEGQSDIHGKTFLPDCVVGLELMHFHSFDLGSCHHRRAGLLLNMLKKTFCIYKISQFNALSRDTFMDAPVVNISTKYMYKSG